MNQRSKKKKIKLNIRKTYVIVNSLNSLYSVSVFGHLSHTGSLATTWNPHKTLKKYDYCTNIHRTPQYTNSLFKMRSEHSNILHKQETLGKLET